MFVCDTQTISGSKIRHTVPKVPPKYLQMKETDIHMIKSAAHEPTLKKLSTTNSIWHTILAQCDDVTKWSPQRCATSVTCRHSLFTYPAWLSSSSFFEKSDCICLCIVHHNSTTDHLNWQWIPRNQTADAVDSINLGAVLISILHCNNLQMYKCDT